MKSFVLLAAAIAALGGLLFGYDTGVISGAILFINQRFGLDTAMQSFVVSVVLIGAIVGASQAGLLADRFGRRRMLLVAGVVFATGALVSAFAGSVGILIAGRCIVGIAIGITSVVSPLYICEVAPAEVRGGLVSLYQFAITVGILCAFIVDYLLAPGRAWEGMLGLAVIPSVLLVGGMLTMPESPRYFFARGNLERARMSLRRIRGTHDVSQEEALINAAGGEHRAETWAALRMPLVRRAIYIGVALAVLQQVTGINTVIYYGPQIFQMAGYHTAGTSILATAVVGLINVLATLIAIFLCDRWGRKPLLYMGAGGMALGLFALAAAFALRDIGNALGVVALLSMMLYVGCFAFSLGPIVWLLISEIYPLRIRGFGMSIATLSNWIGNFLVSLVFLRMIEAFGRTATFAIYGVLCLVTLAFVRFAIPETKNEFLENVSVEAA